MSRKTLLASLLVAAALGWQANPAAGAASDSQVQARLNFDPPRIVVSEKPTRLMLIDGPPAQVAIAGTGMRIESLVNEYD